MGWGRRSDDGTGNVLGKLNKLPWEGEPLTEILPIEKSAALPAALDDRKLATHPRELVTK